LEAVEQKPEERARDDEGERVRRRIRQRRQPGEEPQRESRRYDGGRGRETGERSLARHTRLSHVRHEAPLTIGRP